MILDHLRQSDSRSFRNISPETARIEAAVRLRSGSDTNALTGGHGRA